LGTTLTAGTAAFSGAITLGHDLTLLSPAGGTMLLSGAIGGSGGLIETGGLGLLVLSTSNSYTGGTIVNSGKLEVISPWALPGGTSLTVGANAATIFGATAGGAPVALPAASPVPEPGTLALLTVAVCGAAVYQRLRLCQKKQ
jgi:autotransporter-associated beta strand protein